MANQICKNCGYHFYGNYCTRCGEKVMSAHDKSIPHFIEEAIHFVTHLDGTLLTTIKTMFTAPGRYAADFCYGKRKRYFRPLSLFMLLVVLYLIFPLMSGLNMPFHYYLGNPFSQRIVEWRTGIPMHVLMEKAAAIRNNRMEDNADKRFSQLMVAADSLIKKEPGLAPIAERFDHKSATTSKFLLLLLIPVGAFFLWLLSLKKKRMFYDHLVLSTEINSFFLLFSFLLLPLLLRLVAWPFPGIAENITDARGAIFTLVVLWIYCAMAIRTFYGNFKLVAAVKSLLFVLCFAFFFQVVYKLLLFIIIFYISVG